MGGIIGFETGREWHFDTGEVWVGYLVSTEPEEICDPNKCIGCDGWFIKKEKVYLVRNQSIYHEVDGHDLITPPIGYLCGGCFGKAQSTGKFREGEIRDKAQVS
ncbi:MAG: hypothetical protein Q7S82_02000 [bacterium]|nr:hypothetical protein [bacterium]